MTGDSLCKGCMNPKTSGTCPICGWAEGSRNDSPLHLQPGTVLSGRYLLGRALGQGGFGITYLSYDLISRRRLAVKEFFPLSLVLLGHKPNNLDIPTFPPTSL